ncbi:MAG: cyclase family protein [Anaerolineaceae bacterium]
MKIYDISVIYSTDMPVWPGDPKINLKRVNKIEEGANANVSEISMGVHTGTHVDAPYHFLMNGGSVDQLPLDVLIGPVQVIELPESVDLIDAKVLRRAKILNGVERVLFKTRNSRYWSEKEDFQTDFVAISADGAKLLVDLNVKLVGIDYLSIAPYKNSRPTHEILLEAKTVIIEGLNLSNIEAGIYNLYCLPLKFKDTDGAPARVILIREV